MSFLAGRTGRSSFTSTDALLDAPFGICTESAGRAASGVLCCLCSAAVPQGGGSLLMGSSLASFATWLRSFDARIELSLAAAVRRSYECTRHALSSRRAGESARASDYTRLHILSPAVHFSHGHTQRSNANACCIHGSSPLKDAWRRHGIRKRAPRGP